jgi:hypothetical protein
MNYISIIFIILFSFSCVNNKKTSNSITELVIEKDTNNLVMNEGVKIYFYVSFYSPGDGIDYKVKKEYDEFLLEEYPAIKHAQKTWGKEGETDYCFDLTSIRKEDQTLFKKRSKEILEKSLRVRVSELDSCN